MCKHAEPCLPLVRPAAPQYHGIQWHHQDHSQNMDCHHLGIREQSLEAVVVCLGSPHNPRVQATLHSSSLTFYVSRESNTELAYL